MANLYRLIGGFLLAVVSWPSIAADVAPTESWVASDSYGRSGSGATASAACQAWGAAVIAASNSSAPENGPWSGSASYVGSGTCRLTYSNKWLTNATANGNAQRTLSCPSGYTLGSDNMCKPDAGAGTDHQKSCFAFSGLETLSGGVLAQDVELKGDVAHGSNFCYPLSDSPGKGCAVTFSRTAMANWSDGFKVSYGTYSMTSTGRTYGNNQPDYSCSSDATNKPTPNATSTGEKCTGYVGTVNGVETCVPGTSSANGVDITGGSSTTTNSDGSTATTTDSTKCAGASCTTTTTTTTTTSTGSTSTSTRNETMDRATYCRGAGSATAACGDGDGDDPSKFGGSCGAGFTCEGDAIQCAIAREQHVRACKLFDDKSPESELYAAEVAKGTQRNVTGDLPGNETIDVASKLNTGNLLGTAQCPGDLNVTVWRTEVALPFSRLCQPLDYMGWILVAVAGIAGFRIVSGTSKES